MAVESDLSDALEQTSQVLSLEVSRAAEADATVMDDADLEKFFACESCESDGEMRLS